MVGVYDITAAVDENDLVTKVASFWDGALQLKHELTALSCFARSCSNLLKQGCKIANGFAHLMRAKKGAAPFKSVSVL